MAVGTALARTANLFGARGIARSRSAPYAALLAVVAIAAVTASRADAATSEGAVISNATVQLGVNAEGSLNYDCQAATDTVCPDPSQETGVVGLRYVPTNLESTAPGCLCEGWGIADAGSGLTGFANEESGNANITVDSFSAPTANRAISNVLVADAAIPGYGIRIVQDYHPSPLSPNLYVDTVTVTNTGTNPLTDLRYRRVMDWDVEPTAFEEWVTNQGTSPQLLFSSDDGFASSDPLSGRSYVESEAVCGTGYTGVCQFTDLGTGGTYPTVTTPSDHGGLFDFGLGALAPNETRSFNVYYGAANGETAATQALQTGGAQVYSLGESNCGGDTIETCFDSPAGAPAGVTMGKPATFVFGFVTTVGDLSITKTDTPDPVVVDHNLTYAIHVNNNGPEAAAGVVVTDPLPAGVDLVSATPDQGSCSGTTTVTCNLGSIALNGDVDISVVVTPHNVTSDLANTATVTSTSSDANPSNDSATSHTQVIPDMPPQNLTVTKNGTGTGTVTSSPAGINCGATCSSSFAFGSTVTLTGTPGANSQAVTWSGCDSVNASNQCVVTMSTAKSVTATFNLVQRTLTVTKNGTGTGTVTSSPSGINCGATCSAQYDHGTSVTLTGTPGANTQAVSWSGCDSVNGSNQCIVAMTSARTVTATFNLVQRTLTVTKNGTGGGTVTSSPAGINCGATCSAQFDHGTSVTLTGTPDASSQAVSWSGCDSVNGSNQCIVAMTAARAVTATFNLGERTLTVTKNGSGTGTVTSSPAGIDCGSTCSAQYADGTSVTLTGTPGANTQPVSWSGCDSVNGSNQCIVAMTSARTVTATFNLVKRTLTVTRAGTGSGSVASLPAGINCGSTCTAAYDHGTVVALFASPQAGSIFAGWSGDCSGTGSCTVTMTSARSVTATFIPDPYTQPPPPPPPPTATCHGEDATIVGTNAKDNIKGTKSDDVIVALDGNDKVNAKAGDDIVCMGDGKDRAVGGTGKDKLFGEAGKDHLIGNAGNDHLDGGPGDDKCQGGAGTDTTQHCEA
jgi:uncharacterized repeat protein (TIGR01451 family)